MRPRLIAACLFLLALTAFAQGDRGTITGTLADSTGAVVASAAIATKNVETGAQYQSASTTTGNYTLSELPAGSYEVSVSVPGFKKYVRQGLTVAGPQLSLFRSQQGFRFESGRMEPACRRPVRHVCGLL
jgi:hypothetical protein